MTQEKGAGYYEKQYYFGMCGDGERLYLTNKNQRNTPERLELKKYSPKLRRRAIFREIKK